MADRALFFLLIGFRYSVVMKDIWIRPRSLVGGIKLSELGRDWLIGRLLICNFALFDFALFHIHI